MKHPSIPLLALVLGLCLSGCGWMEGSYVSVEPHQVGYRQDTGSETVVSSYSELRNAITSLVDDREEEAVLTLSDYPAERVEQDMAGVVTYVTERYPIGVYAVSSIQSAYGQNLLSVKISYNRSKAEMEQIHNVRGIEGAKDAIIQALTEFDDSLVVQVSGYTDTDFAQFVADFAASYPEVVMELPQLTAQTYPQQGAVRILELQFSYQNSRESLRFMQSQVQQVFSSAQLYVAGESNEQVKRTQLYGFLMERFDYTIQTSLTPSYSLLCYGVGDSRAFSQVYAALCRQSGMEVQTVSGTRNGESRFWNIVQDGDTYYHVDLLECARQGRYFQCSDWEMGDYVWDYSAFPSCGIPIDPTIDQTEPSEAPESTEPASTEIPE